MKLGGLQLMLSVQEFGLTETLRWLNVTYCFHDIGRNEEAIVGGMGYVEPIPERITTLCSQVLPLELVRRWIAKFPVVKMEEGDKLPIGTVGETLTIEVG